MRLAKIALCLALAAGAGLPAFAEENVRVFTPVDEYGNPTGPSRTIVIPEEPNAGATVEPVDENGDPVGPAIEIPDAIDTIPDVDEPGDDLVPIDG